MYTNIEETKTGLTLAQNFVAKHGELITKYESEGEYLNLNISDSKVTLTGMGSTVVTLGKVFGTTGWSRIIAYDTTKFNWTKKVDEVEIMICNAEDNTLNNSPVNPKDFPIQLEDSPCPVRTIEQDDEISF